MENATRTYHQGTWQQQPGLEIARSHCPTVNYKGKIYGFGGGGPNFKSQNTTVIFDPTTNSWSYGANMPTKRSGTVAQLVGDRIYVIGGGFKQENGTFKFLRTTEIYDPNTDSWEAGPDMIQPHDFPGGISHDGYIYILGGHHPDAVVAGPQTDPGFEFCERLNLKTGEWEQIASLPTPRFALTAVVINNKIVTMGGVAFRPEGFNNFDHTEVYDPASNTWTHGEITLPWTSAGQGSCMVNDQLFIFGGYSGDGISDHAACYDTTNKQWHILPPMPNTLAAMGVSVIGNTIYLLGGWADDRRDPQDFLFSYKF